MADDGRTAELAEFAESYSNDVLEIKRALVSLDENQDGEPVTRVLLLLTALVATRGMSTTSVRYAKRSDGRRPISSFRRSHRLS
jgi:hypothetical protein